MIKTLIVAVVFCLPLLACPKPSGAYIHPEIQWRITSLNSVKDIRVVKRLKGVATGYYAPKKGQRTYNSGSYKKEVILNGKGGETITGVRPQIGTISANLKQFPPRTILRITDKETGQQYVGMVEDTGEAMKRSSSHIDLFMGEGQKGLDLAKNWGKRKVEIEVIKLVHSKKIKIIS
ncbi:MAG: hypothetical protein WCG01_04220 [bacterium]